jgi:CMP-N,N'-diacetyllegionaminic acid synthase
MKPLVIIPARGGSKGLPKKNIKKLNGIPLINWTINTARELFDDKYICISTDSIEIKKNCENLGLKVPFLRPEELSTDEATTYDVLLHALEFYESINYIPDTLILLQPTSPFRNSMHLKQAISLYTESIQMLVSVKETKSNPYYTLFEEDENGFLIKSKNGNYQRRQDLPKVFEYNGAIFIINIEELKKSKINEFKKIRKFEMDELSSQDIDSPFDFMICEEIIKRNLI